LIVQSWVLLRNIRTRTGNTRRKSTSDPDLEKGPGRGKEKVDAIILRKMNVHTEVKVSPIAGTEIIIQAILVILLRQNRQINLSKKKQVDINAVFFILSFCFGPSV
jgi:hypothetical protein